RHRRRHQSWLWLPRAMPGPKGGRPTDRHPPLNLGRRTLLCDAILKEVRERPANVRVRLPRGTSGRAHLFSKRSPYLTIPKNSHEGSRDPAPLSRSRAGFSFWRLHAARLLPAESSAQLKPFFAPDETIVGLRLRTLLLSR